MNAKRLQAEKARLLKEEQDRLSLLEIIRKHKAAQMLGFAQAEEAEKQRRATEMKALELVAFARQAAEDAEFAAQEHAAQERKRLASERKA